MSGAGEGGIASEVAAQVPFPVTLNDRFQNVAPAVGAVDIAGTQGAPFQIAELVEQEQRMVAGAAEVAVVGRALLFAMGRADTAVHVEHDRLRRVAVMHTVDPMPGKIGQRGKVLVAGQKLRLEAPHLAGGRGLSFDGLAADNPAHRRITSQTVGVVHVLIAAKASKDRLTKQPRHAVPSVLAGAAVLEKTSGNLGQAKGIVKLPIGFVTSPDCSFIGLLPHSASFSPDYWLTVFCWNSALRFSESEPQQYSSDALVSNQAPSNVHTQRTPALRPLRRMLRLG